MKNFLSIVFVFLLAFAQTVLAEIRVPPLASNDSGVVRASSSPTISSSPATEEDIKVLAMSIQRNSREAEALRRSFEKKNKKIDELTKEGGTVDKIGENLDEMSGKVKTLSDSFDKLVINDGVLSNNFTTMANSITAIENKIDNDSEEMNNLKSAVSRNTSMVFFLAVLVLLLGFAGWWCFWRVGKKIDKVPAKIVELSKMESLIQLSDIEGHDIVFHPSFEGRGWPSLKVPKSVKFSRFELFLLRFKLRGKRLVNIPRLFEKTTTKMRASLVEVLTGYFRGAFEGTDAYSVVRRMVIEDAISSGQLEILSSPNLGSNGPDLGGIFKDDDKEPFIG